MASLREFDREQAIIAQLDASGVVEVKALARTFGVSTVTIRKDLALLHERGLVRRIRGGALVAPRSDEGSFDFRHRGASPAKRAVARRAARLVRPGDVIAIDASTTCYYLAEELLGVHPLTIITNGLRAATLLMQHSDAAVVMPGGVLRKASGSMVGFPADVFTGRGRVDKGFFGLVGLSRERGLLDLTPEEAHAKAAMAHACRQVIAIFDSSKIDHFGMHTFVATDKVARLISDDQVPPAIHASWTRAGVAWDLVSLNGRH